MKCVYNKMGIAPLYMGAIHIVKNIDINTVRIEVTFTIGENRVPNSFAVKGTLSIAENWFHWDTDNEREIEPYFRGYPISISKAIENR